MKQSIERHPDRVAVRDWPLLDRSGNCCSSIDNIANRLGMRRKQSSADSFHDSGIALALLKDCLWNDQTSQDDQNLYILQASSDS